MRYIQTTSCTEWMFKGFPEFHGGRLDPRFVCGGTGKENDNLVSMSSFVHMYNDVSREEMESYFSAVENENIECVYKSETDGNLFRQFVIHEGLLYVSWFQNTGKAKFILDRCSQFIPFGMSAKNLKEIRFDTVFSQYSLHYSHMIRGTTTDCGMNYVFRLRDNSVIIVDGGQSEQCTEEAVNDYMDFLHDITSTPKGGKIKVSLWICTHAHNDHMDFFAKCIKYRRSELDVERAVFNFPWTCNSELSSSIENLRGRLRRFYPDIKYMKPHAGQSFTIANAKITVLTSAEECYDLSDGRIIESMNDTSMIFIVEAEGCKALFLGDTCERNGKVLTDNYSGETLSCTFLQAAHHGINEIKDVYDRIPARQLLLPQCRMNMETRFPGIFSNLKRVYGEKNVRLAHDETVIYTLSEGKYTVRTRPHVGSEYDGSDI